jgi:orotidine-5'-phosphate decarboxylase
MNLPIILALDTKDVSKAASIIDQSIDSIKHFKVGLEFLLRNGYEGVRKLQNCGEFKLFLDLKLYDIPNTVKGAVESVAALKPTFLTVHAAGGSKMISAAAQALPDGSIAAVTVLTSFSAQEFESMGQKNSIEKTAINWAQMAINAGAKSIVCSPFEVSALRELSNNITLIAPGVRVDGDELGDQFRAMSPNQAILAGADLVVIGRPITQLWEPSGVKMRQKIDQIAQMLD